MSLYVSHRDLLSLDGHSGGRPETHWQHYTMNCVGKAAAISKKQDLVEIITQSEYRADLNGYLRTPLHYPRKRLSAGSVYHSLTGAK